MRAAVTQGRRSMRIVDVPPPGEPGPGEVLLRPEAVGLCGSDFLGVSCCNADEFADAVSLVARRREALAGLVTHEFPLDEAPDAIEYAIGHPAEVVKALIRL